MTPLQGESMLTSCYNDDVAPERAPSSFWRRHDTLQKCKNKPIKCSEHKGFLLFELVQRARCCRGYAGSPKSEVHRFRSRRNYINEPTDGEITEPDFCKSKPIKLRRILLFSETRLYRRYVGRCGGSVASPPCSGGLTTSMPHR